MTLSGAAPSPEPARSLSGARRSGGHQTGRGPGAPAVTSGPPEVSTSRDCATGPISLAVTRVTCRGEGPGRTVRSHCTSHLFSSFRHSSEKETPKVLSLESSLVVKATLPAVKASAVAISDAMYESLLASDPELKSLFNMGNQANGEQKLALATSVVAGAEFLVGDDIPFAAMLDRISHKHASLGISPSQYTVVARHLMKAVGEVLGAAVTPEVAAAWDEVYWLFACHLIAAEARLYQQAGVEAHSALAEWNVVRRREEVEDVVSFGLTPANGDAIPSFLPGQYVSVAVDLPDGSHQLRQYSISNAPGGDTLRITVRRMRSADGKPDGAVSTKLVESVFEGARLHLSKPFGDVGMEDGEGPVVLASAGIGITPIVSMVDHLVRSKPEREVVVVHADRSPATHAFRDEVSSAVASMSRARQLTWYESGEPGSQGASGREEVRQGYVEADRIPVPEKAKAYLCGPLPFMRTVRSALIGNGVDSSDISYEVFGPDLWAGQPDVAVL